MRRNLTTAEHFNAIKEWYGRHQSDYNAYDNSLPPKVWSEYFRWLIHRVEDLEHAERVRDLAAKS